MSREKEKRDPCFAVSKPETEEVRAQAGLTQEELSLKLGVTCRTLQNYESGNVYPKKREIYGILASVFQTDVDYWLTESDGSESRVSLEARELVEKVSNLFFDGNMSSAEMDNMMKSIQDAYWEAKESNIRTVKK